MIEVLTGLPAHTVGFKLSGTLHDADYQQFVPLVDAEIAKEGKVNVLPRGRSLAAPCRGYLPRLGEQRRRCRLGGPRLAAVMLDSPGHARPAVIYFDPQSPDPVAAAFRPIGQRSA